MAARTNQTAGSHGALFCPESSQRSPSTLYGTALLQAQPDAIRNG